ncbi:uncharacterized protein LOC118435787 isoform X2 [Folsomia candida]|nr:uncharacterized protein LOC118435787 isoform X2 [Folsomia candida]
MYLYYTNIYPHEWRPEIRELDQENKLHVRCDPLDKSKQCVTIVTAFFSAGKSKHSLDEYKSWMKNFFDQVESPVVVFTQPSMRETMEKMRVGKPIHFLIYDEIWDLPWLNEPHFLYKDYHEINKLDPERAYHSPELYANWNSKPWMLKTVTEINPFNSTYFYWMDIGSVRNPKTKLNKFLNVDRAIEVFGRNERSENYHKLNVFSVANLDDLNLFRDAKTLEEMPNTSFLIGGFFGGTIYSIYWFNDTFYKLHNDWLSDGIFVGKDQVLYNWIAIRNPQRYRVVCSCEQVPWTCDDIWFYFQAWYSGKSSACSTASVKNMVEFLFRLR